MRRQWIEHLACPRSGAAYDLDPIRVSEDEVVEGFLVSQDQREVRPLFAGIAVLSHDLGRHLTDYGNVYRRSPINDPRLARFLLGRAGAGYDIVPFEVVVEHYRDLAEDPPEGYDTSLNAEDAALGALLSACLGAGERTGRALDIGCNVGRGVFVLCERMATVLGVDRSVACVRRARNVAVTSEHFFLPAPKDSGLKEIPLDLSRLVREGADFAVADADALPFADATFDVVLLRAGDAKGAWPDPARAASQARRVLAPGGLLLWHEDAEGAGGMPEAEERAAPFRAARVP